MSHCLCQKRGQGCRIHTMLLLSSKRLSFIISKNASCGRQYGTICCHLGGRGRRNSRISPHNRIFVVHRSVPFGSLVDIYEGKKIARLLDSCDVVARLRDFSVPRCFKFWGRMRWAMQCVVEKLTVQRGSSWMSPRWTILKISDDQIEVKSQALPHSTFTAEGNAPVLYKVPMHEYAYWKFGICWQWQWQCRDIWWVACGNDDWCLSCAGPRPTAPCHHSRIHRLHRMHSARGIPRLGRVKHFLPNLIGREPCTIISAFARLPIYLVSTYANRQNDLRIPQCIWTSLLLRAVNLHDMQL